MKDANKHKRDHMARIYQSSQAPPRGVERIGKGKMTARKGEEEGERGR